jgi:hypothetical protein
VSAWGPWGPAVEQRFPVIDVEHGIVLGMTLLMYHNQVVYASEIFKVERGGITHIDNIGLVKPGLEAHDRLRNAQVTEREVGR